MVKTLSIKCALNYTINCALHCALHYIMHYITLHYIPANLYLFKVRMETLEESVKNVQI